LEAVLDTAIEVSELVVERGGRTVLDGLSFSVERGSVTGLLGPSGSGKSTLMRCIVGIQVVRSGSVVVFGEPAGSVRLRREIGYMTQSPSVYDDLSVRENARYFATLYGLGSDEADRVIEEVGLQKAAAQLVRTLSGGQRARASLACALIGGPRVLVLDEPTVGQDPVLRDELWQRFNALAGQGVTILVSSHVMDEAGRCSRLLLLSEGRLIADGTPDSVRQVGGSADLDEAFLHLVLASRGQEKA
jgi:ABC-2 type transport system ATP-binding protein